MSSKFLFAALGVGFMLASCGNQKSEYDRYYEQDYKDSIADVIAQTPEPAPGTRTPKAPVAQQPVQEVHPGSTLIAGSDCTACHSNQQKLVGPAYVDVAAKYEANDKNRSYLIGKIKQGGAGVWGQVPMPPHPNISDDDAGKMVDYILSLKK